MNLRRGAGFAVHKVASHYERRTHRGHGADGFVTVHSQGGLGNQLFIYAAGRAAAQGAGAGLRVDVGQHELRSDRPFLLVDLGLPFDEVVDLGSPEKRRGPNALMDGIRSVPFACDYRESSFRYDPSALRDREGQCLFGYFQSWRYGVAVSDDIREHFDTFRATRAPLLASAAEAVREPGAIVLHVRRGDYLDPSALQFHGVASSAYYRQAVSVLRAMGFDGPLLLLSDDVSSAMAELSGLGDVRALASGGLEAVDEMLLMAEATALVTANSSFSWWGGWLGDRADRPVISPRPWFDDPANDSRDLLPPTWLTIERRDLAGSRS